MFFVRPSGDVYRWRRGGCDMKGSRVSGDVSESEVTPKAFPQSSGSRGGLTPPPSDRPKYLQRRDRKRNTTIKYNWEQCKVKL